MIHSRQNERIMDKGTATKIDSILSSLDQVQRASAPAYFYTKLKGRMQKKTERPVGFWMLRPVPAIALLLMLLGVNAYLLLDLQQENIDFARATDNEYPNAIASEYRLQENLTFYENGQELAGK